MAILKMSRSKSTTFRIISELLFIATLSFLMGTNARAAAYDVFIGTYTGGASQGIYSFHFDDATGEVGPVTLVAKSENPSFLALHPNKPYLYAVNEVNQFEGASSGAVSAYRIHRSEKLELLNQLPSAGAAPCHLVVDDRGEHLLVANYNGGNIAVFSLAPDGALGQRSDLVQHIGSSVNRRRQNGPHAHSINLDRRNHFAAAADLGVDKVFVYPLNRKTGRLNLSAAQSVTLAPGAGPRHFAFHPNGKLAFVNNELHSSLSSLRYHQNTGDLQLIETQSTLPEAYTGGNSTAETQVHPNGKFVYVSNRGHNSIAIFQVDQESGRIKRVGVESTQGKTPRNFGLDPQGKHLFAANQSSDTVVIFKVNAETGKLTPTQTTIQVPTPVCVKFKPL